MKGQPSPASLPKESHGQSSLAELLSKQPQRVGHDWLNTQHTKGPQYLVIYDPAWNIHENIQSLPKDPWYLIIFLPIQNVLEDTWSMPKSLRYFVLTKTTSHEPNMTMDSLDRIKFQGPFCVDQMSYGCLDRPNVLQGHWRVLDSLVGLQTWPRHVWAADPLAFCSSGTKASCLTVNPGMVFPHLRLIFFFFFFSSL